LLLAFILLAKTMSFWCIGLIIPVSALASIAGACYSNTDTETDLD
jgi:hypothetical protein